MKKLMIYAAMCAASCATVRPAFAALSADLTIVEKQGKNAGVSLMYAEVLVSGIADCPTEGSVTIVFTSPNEKAFVSSEFEAPWRACSADPDDSDGDRKRGTARTRAYRTVKTGKRHAVGVWKVQVKAGNLVLASGEYEVR